MRPHPITRPEAIFASSQEYFGSARGATWHKWDLHVHTPASFEQSYGDKQQARTWEKYIAALASLPAEIRAIGINDYFSIEGYRRIREAKAAGRLPNLNLILPVVEIRLTVLVGHTDLRKLNFHVVFSDELSPDDIQQFFLNQLSVTKHLDSGMPWHGNLGTVAGIEQLGKAVLDATPPKKRTSHSAIQAGFASAAVEAETVFKALKQSIFERKYLTALGLSEWGQMRWIGAGAAEKRDAIGRVDFVLSASPSTAKYQDQRAKLREDGVNDRILHASDAHFYADATEPNRLGQTLCWLKADLTFRGLQRALHCFDDRVYVGDVPPKLDRIRRNRNKYIRKIEVRRQEGASLAEKWFDTSLEISPDLVAIIGNQGSGKSALADIIALCGNSKVDGFSFLTPAKFCDRQKKAAAFTAWLTWEDGDRVERPLDTRRKDSEAERVRYVPQSFFDAVTNETAVSEGGQFYGEVKKAIFSHVTADSRLGCTSLDELVKKHTSASSEGLTQLRQQLSALNRDIVECEKACTSSEEERVVGLLAYKETELATLRNSPPVPPENVSGADADPETQRLREAEAQLKARVERLESERAVLKKMRTALANAREGLHAVERQARKSIEQLGRRLAAEGVELDLSRCLTVAAHPETLEAALIEADLKIAAADLGLDHQGDPMRADAVAAQLTQATALRQARERELEAATSAYEAYCTRLLVWEGQLEEVEGDAELPAPESVRGLKAQLEQVRVAIPAKLADLKLARGQICREIHETIARLAAVYQDIAEPVRRHIEADPLTRDRYRLAFDVKITEAGLADILFGCVNQTSGTFAGKEAGRVRLRELIAEADFMTAEGAVAFAECLLDHLNRNHKHEPPITFELEPALKHGTTLQHIYDLVFGLEYLRPNFELALNGKPLRQLSPGERGILLLVFYLLVDCGDEPLLIDQPEGNLNNQSIVDHLVPVFARAKERRQIIIVTHNPNLAVVCDAEQIIHAALDINDGNRLTYDSGALENPKFRELSLDLLDGTARAFVARQATYEVGTRTRDLAV